MSSGVSVSKCSGEEWSWFALTGWGQDEDRRRSHEAGFDFHIVKPVELPALEKCLTGRRRRESWSSTCRLRPTNVTEKSRGREYWHRISGGFGGHRPFSLLELQSPDPQEFAATIHKLAAKINHLKQLEPSQLAKVAVAINQRNDFRFVPGIGKGIAGLAPNPH